VLTTLTVTPAAGLMLRRLLATAQAKTDLSAARSPSLIVLGLAPSSRRRWSLNLTTSSDETARASSWPRKATNRSRMRSYLVMVLSAVPTAIASAFHASVTPVTLAFGELLGSAGKRAAFGSGL